jgi:hypothetical protein
MEKQTQIQTSSKIAVINRRSAGFVTSKSLRTLSTPFAQGSMGPMKIHSEQNTIAYSSDSDTTVTFENKTTFDSILDYEKVLTKNIEKTFELSPAAIKILKAFWITQKPGSLVCPMSHQICDEHINIGKTTYHRGVSELIEKKLLSKSIPSFWHLNPVIWGAIHEGPKQSKVLISSFGRLVIMKAERPALNKSMEFRETLLCRLKM